MLLASVFREGEWLTEVIVIVCALLSGEISEFELVGGMH
jgi:hypothetical protein